tara:strand:- start:96 stop:593 length:498 start_codon:yes stop_codon:yes gene_type:complete
MSLEDTEVNIGGVKFKGVYIAVVLGIVSSIGGAIWTASSIYSRLEAVEAYEIPDTTELHEEIQLIKQELTDNDISQLQGKLATLQTNLTTIITQQGELLKIKERVVEAEKTVTEMETTVKKAEIATEEVKRFDEYLQEQDKRIDKVNKEIDDIWEGMDALANPLG